MKKKPKRVNRRAKSKAFHKAYLVESLKQLGEGLTPPERVKAHIEFYEKHCSLLQQGILREIFAEEADKESTELCEFFAETYHG